MTIPRCKTFLYAFGDTINLNCFPVIEYRLLDRSGYKGGGAEFNPRGKDDAPPPRKTLGRGQDFSETIYHLTYDTSMNFDVFKTSSYAF